MEKTRDSSEDDETSGERRWSVVTSSVVFADAPDIAHFLILVLIFVPCLACSSIGCFLGREPLDVFWDFAIRLITKRT